MVALPPSAANTSGSFHHEAGKPMSEANAVFWATQCRSGKGVGATGLE
jgi:hypothetical protein